MLTDTEGSWKTCNTLTGNAPSERYTAESKDLLNHPLIIFEVELSNGFQWDTKANNDSFKPLPLQTAEGIEEA